MTVQNAIPVIDLFAGPGGLCEGFSSVNDDEGNSRFSVKVSIEKDPVAHRTLHLRALFRKFPKGKAPDIYYEYIRGSVKREEFLAHPLPSVFAGGPFAPARQKSQRPKSL